MTLNMKATKDTTSAVKPIYVHRTYVLDGYYWIVHEALNAVKVMYPAEFFTSTKAVEAFCAGEGINPADTIISYEEV